MGKRDNKKIFRNVKVGVGILLILLLLSAIGTLVAAVNVDNVNFIEALSGISSFFVAILTALYVYTTSKQIDVATKQLEEMKEERAISEQPLVVMKKDDFHIEKPDFYFSPCVKEYSIQSRYFYKIKLINYSNFAAVSIDVSAEILVPDNDSWLTFSACQHRINVLSAGQESQEISIMFVNDSDTKLFTSLRELSVKKLPLIRLLIYYKNLCGGYYKIEEVRQLVSHEDSENYVRKWQKQIIAFKTEQMEVLKVLSKMTEKDEKRDQLFESMKASLELALDGRKEIQIQTREVPSMFNISLLTEKEYLDSIKNFTYARPLHKIAECIKE